MEKIKILLARIISPSIITTSTALTACVCLTSCSVQYNSLDDFEYRISSIAEYTAFIDHKPNPEIPQGIKPSFANEVGIIITGWKDNSKPRIINKNKTVLIHPRDSYTITEDGTKTKYHVVAFGEHAFGKEMFDQYDLTKQKQGEQPNHYDYRFILPKYLYTMYYSACSWFGSIPLDEKEIYVNSSKIVNPASSDEVLYDNTNNSAWYPHLNVDMSRCNYYNDGSGVPVATVGKFNYNFAFLAIDKFIWPKNNKEWTYLGDDMFEDGQIKCDMNLTGLKNLTTIGHWGCGRWQMPDNDLYLPGAISNLTWESFNGSKIRDLYFPINNNITWQTFTDDDLDAFKSQITQTIDDIINIFIPPIYRDLFDELVDTIITTFEDEIVQGTEGNDVFIFGNIEINHIYTNNELAVNFFKDQVGTLFDEKTHSHNYPELFWSAGMADCPKEKHVKEISIK